MKENHAVALGLAVAGLFLSAVPCMAQSSLTEETLEAIPTAEVPDLGFRNGSFLAVPIPFSNPTIGSGVAGGAAWLYTTDPESNTSSIGFGGFRTDNGSEGFAFGADLNLNANRYKLSVLAGSLDLKYDFTAGGLDLPLEQSGDLYKIDLSYGLTKEFSIGFGLQYAKTAISTNFGGVLPPEVSTALNLDVFKYGLIAEWDRRDSDLYPTTGSLVTLDAFRGEVTGGRGQDYAKAVLQGSYFQPGLGPGSVLAVSGTLCRTSEKAPFFDACSIGLTDGLRGFSVTEYLGSSLVSAQAEYRGRIGNSRWGYVAFGGAGRVNEIVSSLSGTHAAAGVGIRYRLSKSLPVDFSFDATTNNDGEQLYYVFVGQSF